MKLIIGLGNPGKQYENTRHNVGFIYIDSFAKENSFQFKKKYNGLYAEQTINNEKIILLKPQTYMNLSGECVSKFINYYNIDLKNAIVIYDDVDFELGTFKIKRDGSSAGHNGIKNIIQHLHTENIQRIRIGISKNDIPLEKYVLKKFTQDEKKLIENNIPIINNILLDFTNNDIDYLMEKYNRKS